MSQRLASAIWIRDGVHALTHHFKANFFDKFHCNKLIFTSKSIAISRPKSWFINPGIKR